MLARCALVGLYHLRTSWNHYGGALVKTETDKQKDNLMELQSVELMGIFLGVFGFVVAASAVIPDEWLDKIANLTAGSLLLIIGAGAFLKGRAHRKQ
jgi:hypothetical protein